MKCVHSNIMIKLVLYVYCMQDSKARAKTSRLTSMAMTLKQIGMEKKDG